MKRLWWVIAALLVLVPEASRAEKQSYASGHFMLSLDGEPALVKSFAPPKSEAGGTPFVVEIDQHAGDAIWSWVQATLVQGSVPKKLVVQQTPKRRVTFSGALITEVKFPNLDKTSKASGSVKVTIAAQSTGTSKEAIKGTVGKKHKNWLVSNFEVSIPSVPTKRVKKVDALSWTMKVQEVRTGTMRITLDSADAPAWNAWLKSKAVRSGTIALQDESGTTWKTLVLDQLELESVKTAGPNSVAVLEIGKISLK